ncbi:Inner membrane protein YgaP [Thalassocella blandensis]|nr:Inner membrane protein YgaP [Thalassocella blandensis]
MNMVSAKEFIQLKKQNPNITVIDLRTPAEVDKEKLADCHCLPVHEFSAEKLTSLIQNSGKNSNEPVYLLCQSGKRAELATQKLANHPTLKTVILEGGLNAIKLEGMTTIRTTRKSIPLERQVRITAGSLVLLGVLLGFTVTPAFFYLSAFIGAGLIFSGITDTCPMAMLIARMPWNQIRA